MRKKLYFNDSHVYRYSTWNTGCLFPTRIDCNGSIKVADFGLAEDVYSKAYFRQSSSSSVLVPFKWMPPESLEEGVFSEKSDVVSHCFRETVPNDLTKRLDGLCSCMNSKPFTIYGSPCHFHSYVPHTMVTMLLLFLSGHLASPAGKCFQLEGYHMQVLVVGKC